LLLKGQGLTVARPPRATGTLIGAALAAIAVILALGLVAKASTWPVSLTLFLGILGIVGLATAALFFGFWAWSCYSLQYAIDRTGIVVSWGAVRHYISIDRILDVKHGRGEMKARVRGLGWPGHQIGHGDADDIGPVIFFSTHRSPEELVYVKTADVTYGLSPSDPVRFISDFQRFKDAAKPETVPLVRWSWLGMHPIWSDRWAQGLAVAAVILNLALWALIFGLYPDLDNQITIEFPPIGDITTLESRSEILQIPATATVFLVVNLIAGLLFQWRERAATYLLLGGACVFQAAFWIAAIVALVNA
jgi:hypothetical protein